MKITDHQQTGVIEFDLLSSGEFNFEEEGKFGLNISLINRGCAHAPYFAVTVKTAHSETYQVIETLDGLNGFIMGFRIGAGLSGSSVLLPLMRI